MLTNCLAACAHLTITVSEIQRDHIDDDDDSFCLTSLLISVMMILVENRQFFHTSLAFDAPVRGSSRWNSATPFGMEKLEWLGYHMVKKFRRYLYSFWRNSRTSQTDGRTPHAGNCRAMHSIARQ